MGRSNRPAAAPYSPNVALKLPPNSALNDWTLHGSVKGAKKSAVLARSVEARQVPAPLACASGVHATSRPCTLPARRPGQRSGLPVVQSVGDKHGVAKHGAARWCSKLRGAGPGGARPCIAGRTRSERQRSCNMCAGAHCVAGRPWGAHAGRGQRRQAHRRGQPSWPRAAALTLPMAQLRPWRTYSRESPGSRPTGPSCRAASPVGSILRARFHCRSMTNLQWMEGRSTGRRGACQHKKGVGHAGADPTLSRSPERPLLKTPPPAPSSCRALVSPARTGRSHAGRPQSSRVARDVGADAGGLGEEAGGASCSGAHPLCDPLALEVSDLPGGPNRLTRWQDVRPGGAGRLTRGQVVRSGVNMRWVYIGVGGRRQRASLARPLRRRWCAHPLVWQRCPCMRPETWGPPGCSTLCPPALWGCWRR